MIFININWHGGEDIREIERIERLVSAWQHWAWDYDLQDSAVGRIKEILDELDLDYTITMSEDYDL